jgi:hypothetical protein
VGGDKFGMVTYNKHGRFVKHIKMFFGNTKRLRHSEDVTGGIILKRTLMERG